MRKFITLLAILLLLAIVGLIILVTGNLKKEEKKTLKDFKIPADAIVFVSTKKDCPDCELLENDMKTFAKENKLDIIYYYTEEYNKASNKAIEGYIEGKMKLPTVIYFKDNEYVGAISPASSIMNVRDFFVDTGIIESKNNLLLSNDRFKELMSDTTNHLVIIGTGVKLDEYKGLIRVLSKLHNFSYYYSDTSSPNSWDSLTIAENAFKKTINEETIVVSIGNNKIIEHTGDLNKELIEFIKDNEIK